MDSDQRVIYSQNKDMPFEQVLRLYARHDPGYLERPELLYSALTHSHRLTSAWCNGRMIGIGNAVSDGYLFVYYPHLLVDPAYRGQGLGHEIVRRLMAHYSGCRQQVVVADPGVVPFYQRCGFSPAGSAHVLQSGPVSDCAQAQPVVAGPQERMATKNGRLWE